MPSEEAVKTMCPECRVVRWHDRDPAERLDALAEATEGVAGVAD